MNETDELIAAYLQAEELRMLLRRLNALYARQRAGDTSSVTRSRVERSEALLAALQGHPAAMVPEREQCVCHASEEASAR